MKNRTLKSFAITESKNHFHDISRRQNANYERFMQEKADVFQVTEGKAQAMFWAMS